MSNPEYCYYLFHFDPMTNRLTTRLNSIFSLWTSLVGSLLCLDLKFRSKLLTALLTSLNQSFRYLFDINKIYVWPHKTWTWPKVFIWHTYEIWMHSTILACLWVNYLAIIEYITGLTSSYQAQRYLLTSIGDMADQSLSYKLCTHKCYWKPLKTRTVIQLFILHP